MTNTVFDFSSLQQPKASFGSRGNSYTAREAIESFTSFAAPMRSQYAGANTQILVGQDLSFAELSFSSYAFLRADFLSADNATERKNYSDTADFMARIRNNWTPVAENSLETLTWSVNAFINQANANPSY